MSDKYTTDGSHEIVVWESSDLRTWSEPALRIVSPRNGVTIWALDAIWDPPRSSRGSPSTSYTAMDMLLVCKCPQPTQCGQSRDMARCKTA